MILKSVDFSPAFLPIEHLDRVVVRARQHVRQRRVHHDVSDVVGVLFNGLHFFGGIVVVDSELCVVGADNYPLFAHDELSTADGGIRNLNRADLRL